MSSCSARSIGGRCTGSRSRPGSRNASAGKLGVEDGALYHALVRLEERGSIEAEWGETENGRRARYYKLTSTGRAYLKAETAQVARVRVRRDRHPHVPAVGLTPNAACSVLEFVASSASPSDVPTARWREMDDEIRFHLDMRVAQLVARGWTRERRPGRSATPVRSLP